jgi:hypothetical protein
VLIEDPGDHVVAGVGVVGLDSVEQTLEVGCEHCGRVRKIMPDWRSQ